MAEGIPEPETWMIEWEHVAPMVLGVTFFISVASVAILRPISKKLGNLLEAMAVEKQTGVQHDLQRMHTLMESVDARLRLMEERQDFTERLVSADRKELERPYGS